MPTGDEIRDIAAPRPLSPATPLGRALIALEVPDCSCKMSRLCQVMLDERRGKRSGRVCPGLERCQDCPPAADARHPCPHVEALAQKMDGLPIEHLERVEEHWHKMQLDYDRAGYQDRPEGTPALALTRSARLALYERRAIRGHALFHEADVIGDEIEALAIQAEAGKLEGEIRTGKSRNPEPKKENEP